MDKVIAYINRQTGGRSKRKKRLEGAVSCYKINQFLATRSTSFSQQDQQWHCRRFFLLLEKKKEKKTTRYATWQLEKRNPSKKKKPKRPPANSDKHTHRDVSMLHTDTISRPQRSIEKKGGSLGQAGRLVLHTRSQNVTSPCEVGGGSGEAGVGGIVDKTVTGMTKGEFFSNVEKTTEDLYRHAGKGQTNKKRGRQLVDVTRRMAGGNSEM